MNPLNQHAVPSYPYPQQQHTNSYQTPNPNQNMNGNPYQNTQQHQRTNSYPNPNSNLGLNMHPQQQQYPQTSSYSTLPSSTQNPSYSRLHTAPYPPDEPVDAYDRYGPGYDHNQSRSSISGVGNGVGGLGGYRNSDVSTQPVVAEMSAEPARAEVAATPPPSQPVVPEALRPGRRSSGY